MSRKTSFIKFNKETESSTIAVLCNISLSIGTPFFFNFFFIVLAKLFMTMNDNK